MGLLNGRRRSLWRVLAAFLAFSLIAACGNDTEDKAESDDDQGVIGSTTVASDASEVTLGGKLVVGLEAETNSWQPAWGTINTFVAQTFYDPIAIRGGDGDIYPYLAESIEANDDLSEWTITLRDGIEFHDGTPLDAETVKANFDEYLSAEGARSATDAVLIQEIRLDGPLSYTYVLHEGNAAFPDLLTNRMGWPFSMEACRAAGDACGDKPVGTGPFIFDTWNRDSELRVVKNESYWRKDANGIQLPYLDEVIFRPIPDEDSRFQAVRSGDSQVGVTLRQTIVRQAMDASESGDINSLQAIGNNGGGSIINTAVPPVDDVRVRRALALAFDQSALVKILGGEGITPNQTQYFSPDSPWYSQAVADAYPNNDPEAAKAILDEYVNDPERSDGKAPGTPVHIDFACPPDPTLIQLSQGYQSFWSEIGIDVSLSQVDQAVHVTRSVGSADTEPPFVGDYMVNCFRMGSESDPYTTLNGSFGDQTSPGNVTNYTSDNVEEQLEVLRTTSEFAERYAAVESIMMEFAEEVPVLWTGGTATAMFSTLKVHNLAGWTIPGDIPGYGMSSGVTFLTETWLEK